MGVYALSSSHDPPPSAKAEAAAMHMYPPDNEGSYKGTAYARVYYCPRALTAPRMEPPHRRWLSERDTGGPRSTRPTSGSAPTRYAIDWILQDAAVDTARTLTDYLRPPRSRRYVLSVLKRHVLIR